MINCRARINLLFLSYSSEKLTNSSETKTKDMDATSFNDVCKPNISPEPSANMLEYRVYPERWWLLSAVLLLNVSNYAHWVAFPVVVKV